MTIKNSVNLGTEVAFPLLVSPVYIKNSRFESARLTEELLNALKHQKADVNVAADINERGPDHIEVILSLTLTAQHEGHLIWRAHCEQAGVYEFKGIEDQEDRKRMINEHCVKELYPYACAYINYLIMQGGFPPMGLMPLDLNRLLEEQEIKALSSTPLKQEEGALH